MPVVKLYPNGVTAGMGGNPNPVGGKRTEVRGWSESAVRRHATWLKSVVSEDLTGDGWAVTLTVAECPPDAATWAAMRSRYLKRLERTGVLIRLNWLTEWTRRKIPHMHLAIYLEGEWSQGDAFRLLVLPWLEVAAEYGSKAQGQHCARIYGAPGWFEYQAKHSARGVAHYQRQGVPAGWEKSGRLWGYSGSWPLQEPAEARISRAEYFRWRRLVRSWRVANARAAERQARERMDPRAHRTAVRRIKSARRMLRSNDRTLSEVRGISEFAAEDVWWRLLDVATGGDGAAARAPGVLATPGRPSGWVQEPF